MERPPMTEETYQKFAKVQAELFEQRDELLEVAKEVVAFYHAWKKRGLVSDMATMMALRTTYVKSVVNAAREAIAKAAPDA